jgi:dienelactone hydrolase
MHRLVCLSAFALLSLLPQKVCAQPFGWTCQPKCIDAGVRWGPNTAYVFKGDQYIRFSGDEPEDGYPLPIAGNWPGFPKSWSSGIDAAVDWGKGKVYVFKGGEYIRYDIAAGNADPGYPRPIAGNWGFPQAWSPGIDAGINWGDGKVYFFKGDQYLRYDIASERVDPGFPRAIADQWTGFPRAWSSGIDAAINWGNGKVYIFRGNQYLRYDIDSGGSFRHHGVQSVTANWLIFDEPLSSELNETALKLPVTVTGPNEVKVAGDMIVTHYRPRGNGPFPAVVYSHGRRGSLRSWPPRKRELKEAAFWVQRGFAFFIATRLGYGATGLALDNESAGQCEAIQYDRTVLTTKSVATQAVAVANYAKTLPFVDKSRIIFVGNSLGGLAMMSASGVQLPDGVIAAINFVGGVTDRRLGFGRPCNEANLLRFAGEAGRAARLPMLWLYSESDELWGADLPRQWHAAYTKSGGQAELHMFDSKSGGHSLISHPEVWQAAVNAYLAKLGLAFR